MVLGAETGKTADDRLGYLPEERGLYKRMKVRELLNYYAHLKGNFNCKPEIDYWLERLGATDWVNKKIESLSKRDGSKDPVHRLSRSETATGHPRRAVQRLRSSKP